jgi:hypothetical protein
MDDLMNCVERWCEWLLTECSVVLIAILRPWSLHRDSKMKETYKKKPRGKVFGISAIKPSVLSYGNDA